MNTAEEAFYASLTDVESLDVIVREGFSTEISREVIPSEVGRKLTAWCIEQYFKSGRKIAPDRDAIMQTWGSELAPVEIEIHDDVETNSIQWAIDQLRTDFVDYITGEFAKSLAKEVRQADPDKRADVLQEQSQLLHLLAQAVVSRRNEMDGAEGLSDAIKRYEERAAADHRYEGVTFGMKAVDDHILGVHPGELAVFAATSGGGKSWWAGIFCLEEYKSGRKTILYTLENDVEMTYDRLACLHCHVDYEKWQRSECNEGDLQRVRAFREEMEVASNKPIICQPEEADATGVAMVRRAIIDDCDSLLIDQLSHIEPVAGSKFRQRNDIVAEIVKDLYKQIKRNGSRKISCILFHQINRQGREDARKTGRYQMSHLGEATQIENAADFVFAIYQSPDHEVNEWAELQMLKGRRVKPKDWEIEWRPYVGHVEVRREIERD